MRFSSIVQNKYRNQIENSDHKIRIGFVLIINETTLDFIKNCYKILLEKVNNKVDVYWSNEIELYDISNHYSFEE